MSTVLNPPGSPHFRAVLFDVDGTLYRQPMLRALMAIELLTLPLESPSKSVRRIRALRAYRDAQEALRHGATIGPADQAAAAATASGLPVKEVDELVARWMMQRPLKYLPFCRSAGLLPLLDRLANLGISVGVLSDYPAEAKLAALGLAGRFSPVLSATDREIAAFKPNPRGYLRACEIWGLRPADVLFVGDRPDVDAAGAKAAGMPCAIIGSTGRHASNGAGYQTFTSFERLSRVFDGR